MLIDELVTFPNFCYIYNITDNITEWEVVNTADSVTWQKKAMMLFYIQTDYKLEFANRLIQ